MAYSIKDYPGGVTSRKLLVNLTAWRSPGARAIPRVPQRWVVVGPLSLPYARATRGGRDPDPVEPAFRYLCGVTCKKESGVKLARWDTGEGGSWLKLKLDSGSHCGRPYAFGAPQVFAKC